MSLLARIRGTLRSLLRKEMLDRDLEAELDSYRELLTEENLRAGMEPEQAQRAARLEIGGAEQVKERVRERRLGATLDTLAQDIRYGVRSLRNSAGLTITAVVILALGIGATTILFSTVSAALLGGLPFDEPERLVAGVKTRNGEYSGPVSRVDYFDYRERAEAFEELALIGTGSMRRTVTGGAATESIDLGVVTWNLFAMLGVRPVEGRGFLREEEDRGDASVVVISHALWQSRYGGAPSVLTETLHVDGAAYTIIGVLPAGFEFLVDADVWGLIDRQGPWDQTRDSHSHWVVGRLAPGVALAQAQDEFDAISAGLQERYPDTNAGKGLAIMGLQEFMVADVRVSIVALMWTTALVLLIACSNVAGLLLARGHRRLPELAMRSALGASRVRLVRQLLTESVILTLVAGLVGVWLAYLLQNLVRRVMPMGDLGVNPPAIDAGVLLFAFAVSITTGLVVGVAPALIGAAANPARRLSAGARMSEGGRGMRLRGGFVILQVAVSVVLLVGAGLLVRSLVQLATVDVGFDSDNLLTAGVKIQPGDYPSAEQRSAFFAALLEETEGMPGVLAAGVISKPPILSPWQDWAIWPAQQARPLPQDQFMAMARWASVGYFEAARIDLLQGRDFSAGDVSGAPSVVVVSEMVARALFPGEDPLGRMVGIGWDEAPYEIIGVVADVRVNAVARGLEPAMYMSSAQMGLTQMSLMVRVNGDPAAIVGPLRQAVTVMDPGAVFEDPITMSTVIADSLGRFRVVMLSLAGFAAVALLLAAIGLYGVLAYNVSQRTHEIGVRLAMGAGRYDLIAMVLHRGLLLVGLGLLLGVAAAIPGTRLLQQLLFETQMLEPSIYAAAVVALSLVAVLACLLPAWRTTRVDVVSVLKRD